MAEATGSEERPRETVRHAADGSSVLALHRRASRPVTSATRWLTNAVKHSFLYRWLTRESEPEVIVIDLCETYTVGPIVAFLDRRITAVAPAANELDRAWQASTLYRMGDWVAGWIERGLEARTGQLLFGSSSRQTTNGNEFGDSAPERVMIVPPKWWSFVVRSTTGRPSRITESADVRASHAKR